MDKPNTSLSNHPLKHPDNHFQVQQIVHQDYFCSHCLHKLNGYTFIFISNECYCVACVANMKKYPSSYHVINKLDFPVFNDDWTAYEEAMLFEGLQRNGFGNWSEIATFIGSNKTREDIEEHYHKLFLQQQLLPDIKKIYPSKVAFAKRLGKVKNRNQRSQNTIVTRNLSSLAIDKKYDKTQKTGVLGYMPLRVDFQYEYDDDAELLLAEMEFTDEDTEEEIKLMLNILDLYNQRLTSRNLKKQFVISRNLLNLSQQSFLDKRRSIAEKQMYSMMKIFARFQTAEKHQRLVEGIMKKKQLEQKLSQYKKLRSLGYKSIQQIQHHIEESTQKQLQNKMVNQTRVKKAESWMISQNKKKSKQVQLPMTVQGIDAFLRPAEIKLCRKLKISGVAYTMIRQTMIREYKKNGSLSLSDIGKMFSLDKSALDLIRNYLVESNMVNLSE